MKRFVGSLAVVVLLVAIFDAGRGRERPVGARRGDLG